jgi:ABC-type multidrug transport system ATPase subunit
LIITLENIGKRYNSNWIFKNINFQFKAGNGYAVLGANGSGKSTLLQVIAGSQLASEGKIMYTADKSIDAERIFTYVSIAAPSLDLMEELTLQEAIRFHSRFKTFQQKMDLKTVAMICNLPDSERKPLKYFSSGMKQRVKLALAILSDTPILLLDEPTTNLDKKGIEWYQQLIGQYTSQRLVVVCSNMQEQEYFFCNHFLTVEDFKV